MDMDKLVALCRRRGFIFQSSEIYGGINGFWDYGPLGVELKRNIKDAWWRDNVMMRDDVVGLDCSIIMHPKVWEASGHLAGFSDPLVQCLGECKQRFREDHLREEQPEGELKCPVGGGDLSPPRQFNLVPELRRDPLRVEIGAVGIAGRHWTK